MLNAGAQSPLIHNVRLVNAGQQFIKASPDGAGGGVDNGIVEYSVIEYDTTASDDYTNGVDVHTGDNWIIRHNLFRNIRAPQGALAGPAILMWNASTNTTGRRQHVRRLPARDRARADRAHAERPHRRDCPEQLHLADDAPAIRRSTSPIRPDTQVLHNSIFISRHLREPDRVSLPEHDRRRHRATTCSMAPSPPATARRARSAATTRPRRPRSSSIRPLATCTSSPRRRSC